jgi:transcriptional regulator with XRE-family HTH domain
MASNLSVREMARRSGVSPSVISRFLRGAGISLVTAEKLLAAINWSGNET